LYENEANRDPALAARSIEQHRAHMNHQLEGVEALPGTYPFTLQTSVRAYRINKYLHQLIGADFRQRFLVDPEATFDLAQLPPVERDMIARRDWQAMIRYGVIFFLLEKLGATVGVSNLHIYAAMRGQSLEEFQQTRNAPGALYSVAGSAAAGAADWAKAASPAEPPGR
jgi:gallate dioxygenase